MDEFNEACPLLRLPTELRLLIYGFAILDSSVVTIGTAELVGAHPDIVHRLYGNRRSPVPGIPRNHEPVVQTRYNASLLSIINPAFIPLTPATSCPPEDPSESGPYTTHGNLLLVNKQIREELTSHFKIPKNRRTSLFVAYPHGLHVLKNSTPQLVRQARSVHIAGAYVPKTFNAQRAAYITFSRHTAASQPPGLILNEIEYNGNTTPNHSHHLANLITSAFGPQSTHPIRKLELRTYYPGSDSYSAVWGDDDSPTVVALRSIFAGEISIEVWRGRYGTGVYLTVKPTPVSESGKPRRIVSTVWRKLEEGQRGEPSCGSWVVDPLWPNWEEKMNIREGEFEGCVVSEGV